MQTTPTPATRMATPSEESASGDEDLTMRLRIAEMEKQKAEIERENLRMQLGLLQLNRDSLASIQNPIQLIHDKIADFKKEVTTKNLKLAFKLDESSNYDSWRDEALTQALAIKAKSILKNKKTTCPETITANDNKKIWKIKSEAIFDMLLDGLKSSICQVIKE